MQLRVFEDPLGCTRSLEAIALEVGSLLVTSKKLDTFNFFLRLYSASVK